MLMLRRNGWQDESRNIEGGSDELHSILLSHLFLLSR